MRSLALITLLFVACADGAPVDSDADGQDLGLVTLDGKADGGGATELRARAGEMSVWLRVRTTTDHQSPSGFRVVIHGRASRDLESVMSWVPDDAFGEATIVSARKFEIVLDEAHEINSVLSGAPLYLSLHSKTGTARDYYLRLGLEPRFAAFKGSRALYVSESVLPIYVRDGLTNLRYRGIVTTTRPADSVFVTTDDDADAAVTPFDATTFYFDWTYLGLALAMTPSTDPVGFSATFGAKIESKRAELAPSVVSLAMSTEDPYLSLVTERTCDAAVRTCIAERSGADDLSDCGLYRDVSICLAQGPICGEDSADLELFPIDASGLAENRAAFDQACGSACQLDVIDAFRLPECLEAEPDVAGLVAMLMNLQEYQGDWQGGVLTREALEQSAFIASAGDEGRRLLGVLGGWSGGVRAQYWHATAEVPCHNCHAWQTLTVVYYPDVGRLFVLRGQYGWDS